MRCGRLERGLGRARLGRRCRGSRRRHGGHWTGLALVSNQLANRIDQRVRLERFHHDGVGTRRLRFLLVERLVAPAQHDHGDVLRRRVRLDGATKLDPGPVGQQVVDDDDVGLVPEHTLATLCATGRRHDIVSRGLEGPLDDLPNRPALVDQKYGCHPRNPSGT
jgi:hypothetical protein